MTQDFHLQQRAALLADKVNPLSFVDRRVTGGTPHTAAENTQSTRDLDNLQRLADVIGTVDVSGATDLSNAVVSLMRAVDEPSDRGSHLRNAGMSAIAAIPFFGNVGLLGKGYKNAAVASKTAQQAARVAAQAPGLSRLARINAKLAAHRPGLLVGITHSVTQLTKSIIGRRDSAASSQAAQSPGSGPDESGGSDFAGSLPSAASAPLDFGGALRGASQPQLAFSARAGGQGGGGGRGLQTRAASAPDGFQGQQFAAEPGRSTPGQRTAAGHGTTPPETRGAVDALHDLTSAFVKAGVAVATFSIASRMVSHRILGAQGEHVIYGGTMAGAAALAEARTIGRHVSTARDIGGSYAALSDSTQTLEDTKQPYRNLASNVGNWVMTGVTKMEIFAIKAAEEMTGLRSVVDELNRLLGGNQDVPTAYIQLGRDMAAGKWTPGPTTRPR